MPRKNGQFFKLSLIRVECSATEHVDKKLIAFFLGLCLKELLVGENTI